VLQCVALCEDDVQGDSLLYGVVLQCVAVCCSVLHYVKTTFEEIHFCMGYCCIVLQCVALCEHDVLGRSTSVRGYSAHRNRGNQLLRTLVLGSGCLSFFLSFLGVIWI